MNFHTATNSELDAKAIEFDANQGARALHEVHAFIGRFVSYPSEHARIAHTLWIAHTHLMDKWDITPRIAFLSPEPASGKSRALEVTKLLVPRPMQAVNMSPSSLFRSVGSEDGLPTILFDEIDTVFGPKAKDNEDIRGLLNAGFERGAKTYRSVLRGKAVELEAIEAYCAVALAGLGWLPDTILTRSVIIRMRRRMVGEIIEPYRRRIHGKEGERIRSAIEIWAQSQRDEIEWPELPPEIQDRDADVWEPLIAVAEMARGEWPAKARAAAVSLVTDAKDIEPSLGIRLLGDLRTVFSDQEQMPSKAILAALTALDEAPWGDLRGKQLDQRGLAKRLRQYGVKPKTVRIGDFTAKGYLRSDLAEQWGRYLPALGGGSVTSVTSDTAPEMLTFSDSPVTDVTDADDAEGWQFNR